MRLMRRACGGPMPAPPSSPRPSSSRTRRTTMSKGFSRRGLFKRAAIAAGAMGISRIPGVSFLEREAEADTASEQPALFIFNMIGGYNALFGSADSFQGTGDFGVTATNIKQ